MSDSAIDKIHTLAAQITERAKRKREESEETDEVWTRGYHLGYSHGYELCAAWLVELAANILIEDLQEAILRAEADV